jgi:hypothetical protein
VSRNPNKMCKMYDYVQIIGRGCRDYWRNKWNYVDFFVLIITVQDIGMSFIDCDSNMRSVGFTKILKGLRLFRLVRSIRLLKVKAGKKGWRQMSFFRHHCTCIRKSKNGS